MPDITGPLLDAGVLPVPTVALVTSVGLPAGAVTVCAAPGVVVSVGATPVVGILVGVAPGVVGAVGVLTTVGVTVAVLITVGVGVTGGEVVALGVTAAVGVTTVGVGDGLGFGVTVTPGAGVLGCCAGVAETCWTGTLVCPLLTVIRARGVSPFTLVGLARQGTGVIAGVIATTT